MTRLSSAELAELETRIRAAGPDAVKARDELAVAFHGLAYRIGNRVAHRTGRPEHADDLVQESWLGVLLASRTWDPERGPFMPHAAVTAKRVAWNWVRENGGILTGRGQVTNRRITEASNHLRGTLGREPTLTEVATNSGLALSKVLAFHARGTPLDDEAVLELPDPAPLPDAAAESAQVTQRVRNGVNGLRPKRREVLLMRLSCDEPDLTAIGTRLGLTRQAAQQRHAAALADLRPMLRALV